MKGLIIVNSYKKLEATKYKTQRLEDVFSSLGVEMTVLKCSDISLSITSGTISSDLKKYSFAIYLDKDESMAMAVEKEIPLFNSAASLIQCNDKFKTFLALSGSGIKTPKTIPSRLCFRTEEMDFSQLKAFDEKIIEELYLPLVVKECYGSLGLQVYLIHNEEELLKKEQELILKPHIYQEYIPSSFGRDFRIFTINGKAVACMERVNESDFRSNIALGGRGKKVIPPDSFIEAAEKASKLLGLDYAGVDLLIGPQGEPILTEVNSNPFFGGIESVSHVDVTRLLADHILSKLK